MNPARKFLGIFLVLFAFAGGATFMFFALEGSRATPQHATVLPGPMPLPDFAFTDHSGNAFGRDDLRGKWHLVFFGFTHCPDICPATLQQLAIARNKAGGDFPQIVLISVDPERDSPEVMAEYVAHFGADIKGVTGDIDELTKLTSAIGIFFEKSDSGNGGYGVDHSTVVLLFNKDAEFHALFSAPHHVDNFVNDVPILTGSG